MAVVHRNAEPRCTMTRQRRAKSAGIIGLAVFAAAGLATQPAPGHDEAKAGGTEETSKETVGG